VWAAFAAAPPLHRRLGRTDRAATIHLGRIVGPYSGSPMPIERKFLIASSLARLIRRERGVATRIIEGHFPPRHERSQLVRVEHDRCYLVLRTTSEAGATTEEQVEIPPVHAQALVDVAAGTVALDRTELRLGHGVDAALDCFMFPSGLDLVTVTISSDPRFFAPPRWLGREVSGDPEFDVARLALEGLPTVEEMEISNVALETLLDYVEGRSVSGSPRPPSDVPAADSAQASPSIAPTTIGAARAPTVDGPAARPARGDEQTTQDGGTETEAPTAVAHDAPPGSGPGDDLDPAEPSDTAGRPLSPTNVLEEQDRLGRLARSLAPRRLRSGT
jgi:CYTH domain-containing protein